MKKSLRILCVLVVLAFSFTMMACSKKTEETDATATVAPEATEVPTVTVAPTEAPTPTVAPTEAPAAPALVDASYVSPVANGGSNWYPFAEVKEGAVVYENDFESASGNFLDGSNSYNYAAIAPAFDVAHSGLESVSAGSRQSDTAGIGVRIAAPNGLDIKTLVGCTVKFSAWVYFNDSEYSKAPDAIDFVVFNRLHQVDTDDEGNKVYEEALTQTAKKGEWTQLVAEFKIVDPTDNGMMLIGTKGEELSAAGYLTTYYMDDVKVEVVSLP